MTSYVVVVLKESGEMETMSLDHGKITEFLCGDITFVGGIDDLRLFAVARKDVPEAAIENPWCKNPEFFDTPVQGDVVMLFSDEHGQAGDVDVSSFRNWLSTQPLMVGS